MATVAVDARATGPQPYLSVPYLQRGRTGGVYGFDLLPDTSYMLSSGEEQFALSAATPAVDSLLVTTDAQGRFNAVARLPVDLPLTVDTVTVSLTPQGGSDPLLSTTVPVAPPTFYLPNCPGQQAPVGFLGFPPGTYVLSSPYVSFDPDTTTVDATGVPTRIEATIAVDAPTSFSAYATPSGSTTPAATMPITLYPPHLDAWQFAGSYQISGSCFGPDQPVTITSGAQGVTLPAQVVPDSTGGFSFSDTVTATADARMITVDATDNGTGRSAQTQFQVPGTTLRVGQQLRDNSPASLVSHHMHYQLSERACTLGMSHYIVIDGVLNSPEVWWVGTGDNSRTGCHLSLQPDGNLVLYTARGTLLWSAGTQATGTDNRLVLSDTGNLVLYTKSGCSVWSSKHGRSRLASGDSLLRGQSLQTAALNAQDDQTKLLFTTNGNLTLTRDGRQVWSSHTAGRGGTRLTMQRNGNLVLRRADGSSVWSSRTADHGIGDHLVIRAGVAVILDQNGRRIWRT